jgi:beta-lactamase superfamily II metal-dependent hydrolase
VIGMTTAIRIEALPARLGDCLLVECLRSGTKPWRMLVDGGPPDTWPLLAARLERLPVDDRRLDVVVITHIDSDHIGGMLPFFQSEFAQQNVGQVWFNGFQHLPAPEDRTTRSVAQAESVTTELFGEGPAPAFDWNSAFDGGPVATAESGQFVELPSEDDGPKITVLSPTLKRLTSLRAEWRRALEKAREGLPEVAPPRRVEPLAKLDDLESLAAKATANDGSAPNGSSIGLLLEHRGASCLLSGDAFSKVLSEGLEGLAAARGVEAIEVDAFKLPHHGSQANLASELVAAAPARHYVVSSNGDTFDHPDDTAIARVVVGAPKGPTLWFNYENERTRRWADADLRDRFGHKVKFPETAAAGAVLELPARR